MNSAVLRSRISSILSNINFRTQRIFSSETASSNPSFKKPLNSDIPPRLESSPEASPRKSRRFLKCGVVGGGVVGCAAAVYGYASEGEEEKKKTEALGKSTAAGVYGSASNTLLDKAKKFVGEKIAHVKKPEATINDVDLKDVNRDSVEYDAKISVSNPYGHSLPICEVTYTLKSNGRVIATGNMADPGSLKAKDTTLLIVPLKVPYSIIVSLARDIGADWDIDYGLEVGLTIDLPLIGEFTIPLSTQGEIKLPTLSDLF